MKNTTILGMVLIGAAIFIFPFYALFCYISPNCNESLLRFMKWSFLTWGAAGLMFFWSFVTNKIKSLKYLFKPDFWRMLYPYSKEWDYELTRAMDKYSFKLVYYFDGKSIDRYVAQVGPHIVWVKNYPFLAFSPEKRTLKKFGEVRPSRLTIERAYKKLKKELPDLVD